MLCKQCNMVDYMIEDTTNGCYVCTNCGEVLNETLISDEAMYDKSTDDWSHSYCKDMKTMHGAYNYATKDPQMVQFENFMKTYEEIQDYHQRQIPEFLERYVIIQYEKFKEKFSMQGRCLIDMIYAFIVITSRNHSIVMPFIITPEISKCVKAIEQNVEQPQEVILNPAANEFYDRDIEMIIQKYHHLAELKKNNLSDIFKLISKTEFIMRSKDIVALGIIVVYKKSKNERHWIKILAKEACVSELAIKASVRDIKKAIEIV